MTPQTLLVSLLSGVAIVQATSQHRQLHRHLRTADQDQDAAAQHEFGRDMKSLEEVDFWNRLLQYSTSVTPAVGTPSPTSTPAIGTSSPTSSSTPPLTPGPTPDPTRMTTTPAPIVVSAACSNILWSDEFSSTDGLDRNTWNYDIGRGNDGWGNFELQTYTESNARVQNDILTITVAQQGEGAGRSFTSARINTQDKLEVLYGTIEARIKLPASLENGLWPAFWTLGGNFREFSWPSAGEIDIMEMGSEQSQLENAIHNRVTSAVHWESGDIRASFGESFVTPEPLNDGEFHLFRLEWTSTSITTYVDDNVVFVFDTSPDVCTDCEEFRQPHFLVLNVAVGGIFPGILDESGVTVPLPAEMEIDYVRVCDNGETVLSGSVIEETIDFGFNCGLPDSCTMSALNNYAGDARCGSRIQFLLDSGLSEEEACQQVAFDEFPEYCGVCYEEPLNCDVPETCTAEALNADAAGFPCGDRINFLIGNGQSEVEACRLVAIVEFPNECGACAPPSPSIDCGQQETCTAAALQSDADGFPCGDRIEFLINSQGQSELAACDQIARVEFPSQCGACAPPPPGVDCGVPESCTTSVLMTDAGGFPCGDRIEFLINTNGLSEFEACALIAVDEYPAECGACAPPEQLDCGVPETCTQSVLEADAGGFPCGDRIGFLISTNGLSETEACTQVAETEFPAVCGGCNPNA